VGLRARGEGEKRAIHQEKARWERGMGVHWGSETK